MRQLLVISLSLILIFFARSAFGNDELPDLEPSLDPVSRPLDMDLQIAKRKARIEYIVRELTPEEREKRQRALANQALVQVRLLRRESTKVAQ